MVCKEEVCRWFKELSSAKRIDLLCGMLHMCLPLERRFLGSFLEDLCRLDFTTLRSEELRSNDRSELSKMSCDLLKQSERAQMNLTLSLLNSTNSSCSSILYSVLTFYVQAFINQIKTNHNIECEDIEALYGDIRLLLTIVSYHPAFTFTQRYEFSEHLKIVEEYYTKCGFGTNDNAQDTDSSGAEYASASSHGRRAPSGPTSKQCQHQSKPVHVKALELVSNKQRSQKVAADRKTPFTVTVTWSNDKVESVPKTYQDFYNFHYELVRLFPNDSGAHRQERLIPFFPQEKGHVELREQMAKYVHRLQDLPAYILQCDHVTKFFRARDDDQTSLRPRDVDEPMSDDSVSDDSDSDIGDEFQVPPTKSTHKSAPSNQETKKEVVQAEKTKASKAEENGPVFKSPPSPLPHSVSNSSNSSSSNSKSEAGGTQGPAPVKSLTFYNSHFPRELVSDASVHRPAYGVDGLSRSPRNSVQQLAIKPPLLNARHLCSTHALTVLSPHTSPLPSPMSSPYISPSSSLYSGSRPSSPALRQLFNVHNYMKKMRLHKYSDELSKYSLDQFLNLGDEDLEKCGLTKGAKGRFRIGVEQLKSRLHYEYGTAYYSESENSSPSPHYDVIPDSNAAFSHTSITAAATQALVVNSLTSHTAPRNDLVSRVQRDSCSSCSDDCPSPAPSPQPMQDSGTHSPRVDLSDSSNGKAPERIVQKIQAPRSKRSTSNQLKGTLTGKDATSSDVSVQTCMMNEANIKASNHHAVSRSHSDTSSRESTSRDGSVRNTGSAIVQPHIRGNTPPMLPPTHVPAPPSPITGGYHGSIYMPPPRGFAPRSPRPMLRHELLPHCIQVSQRLPNGLHIPPPAPVTSQHIPGLPSVTGHYVPAPAVKLQSTPPPPPVMQPTVQSLDNGGASGVLSVVQNGISAASGAAYNAQNLYSVPISSVASLLSGSSVASRPNSLEVQRSQENASPTVSNGARADTPKSVSSSSAVRMTSSKVPATSSKGVTSSSKVAPKSSKVLTSKDTSLSKDKTSHKDKPSSKEGTASKERTTSSKESTSSRERINLSKDVTSSKERLTPTSSANNSQHSHTTTTVTYTSGTSPYPTSMSNSPSPVLITTVNSNGSLVTSHSPSPLLMQNPTTVPTPVGDVGVCSECGMSACSHVGSVVVQTPTTPVHLSYSSPVWPHNGPPPPPPPPPPAPAHHHTVFSPHTYPPPPPPSHLPQWSPGTNGLVSPHAYNTMPFTLPPAAHNGYHHHHHHHHPELTFHSGHPLVHNLLNHHSMAQHLMAGGQLGHHHHQAPGLGGYAAMQQHHHPHPGKGKWSSLTCYNCGGPGHKAADCHESTMEAMASFNFNMRPKPETVE